MELKAGIYRIYNKINRHCYVGQSSHVPHRIRDHFTLLKKGRHQNKYLQHAFNLYGEKAFAWEVLEYCKRIKLDLREQYWIEKVEPEYNSILNVFEGVGRYTKREFDEPYVMQEEIFERPSWHRQVYGDHRKTP